MKGKFIFGIWKLPTILLFAFLLTLSPVTITAQVVSAVAGIVTDETNSIVPGVKVTLLDTKTKNELTTTTNNKGIYFFTNVAPRNGYKLSFTQNGFQKKTINNVRLGIAKTETYHVVLAVGQIDETVEVTFASGAPQSTSDSTGATLNTSDASIGNIITTRQLRELPVRIRTSPTALLGLQAGVIGENTGTTSTNRVGSVTGSRADQGSITLDGIDVNNQATQEAFAIVGNAPIDSIQEFRSVSINPNTSEGRTSGGQTQIVTKSGGNKYHGSLREYYRTDRTSANDFFNNRAGGEIPKLNRHQFGGNFSGPLPFFNFGEGGPLFISGKNKLFFFFDYEGRRDNSESTIVRQVPLQHLRDGVIGYINNNPGCNDRSRLDTTPNCISFQSQAESAALDPLGTGINQAFLAFVNERYPVANDFSAGDGINTGGTRFNLPAIRTDNTYTAKIDWQVSDVQKLFIRTTINRERRAGSAARFPGDEDSQPREDRSYSWAAGHRWSVTPNIFNSFTVGVANSVLESPVPNVSTSPNNFSFGAGLANPFPDLNSQSRTVRTPTIRNDITWTMGSHNLKFGGKFKPIRERTTVFNDFNNVHIGLGGEFYSLPPFAKPRDLLLGSFMPEGNNSVSENNYEEVFTTFLGRIAEINTNFNYDRTGASLPLGTGKTRNLVFDEYSFYFQDRVRVRKDLNLTFGVRWRLYPAPYERDGLQAMNDVDFQELLNTRVQNGLAGISGDQAAPLVSYNLSGAGNPDGRPLYPTDRNNFAPRLSFAYNPSFKDGVLGTIFGNRKTSIRGGASLVYDRISGAVPFIQDQYSYIVGNSANTEFGSRAARALFDIRTPLLLTDPRFTSINSIPVQNAAPTITTPFTPSVENRPGFFGVDDAKVNYTVAGDFETPYSYQWSLSIQRELPVDMLLEVSYVGRAGRKLAALSDAGQVVDFIDPASGQSMFEAFNNLQAQIIANAPITPQPWIENQVRSTFPRCRLGSRITCTDLVLSPPLSSPLRNDIARGNTTRVIQRLAGLLNPNVGLSSQFASNGYLTNQASSDYHGMLVSLQKRFSTGFQFDANYSWSHAIDNQSSVTNTVSGGLICDARNPDVCRGNADFDIRHLFNAYGVWDIPLGRGHAIGRNTNKWVNAFIGGWSMAGIVKMHSGTPFNSSSGSHSLNFLSASPSVLIGDAPDITPNIRDEGDGIQYFADPDAVRTAFRFPRHGESGTRNFFRSPGFWNVDMAISKKWGMPWSETHLLTFRVEAFNVTNSTSFRAPDVFFQSPDFGRITSSSSDPREMQFALRYDF